tara:strand:+ start:48435 stop:48572 length:138 start_codon:yes stop_codon:yes gene_type:complete
MAKNKDSQQKNKDFLLTGFVLCNWFVSLLYIFHSPITLKTKNLTT